MVYLSQQNREVSLRLLGLPYYSQVMRSLVQWLKDPLSSLCCQRVEVSRLSEGPSLACKVYPKGPRTQIIGS